MRAISRWAAVTALSLAAGLALGQTSAKELCDQAVAAKRAGDYATAVAKLEAALVADPKYAEALRILGWCHLAEDNPKRDQAAARNAFTRYLALQPEGGSSQVQDVKDKVAELGAAAGPASPAGGTPGAAAEPGTKQPAGPVAVVVLVVIVLVVLSAGIALGRRSAARTSRDGSASQPASSSGATGSRPRRPGPGPKTAADLQAMASQTPFKFLRSDSGGCHFLFEAKNRPDSVLVVAKMSSEGTYVSVYSTCLGNLTNPPYALLVRLMEMNESQWQGKWSLTKTGDVDYQFECPTATLDVQELGECVAACAKVVDESYPELKQLAG